MNTTLRRVTVAVVLMLMVVPLSLRTAEIDRREVGNLVIEGIPEIPEELENRMLQYQNTRSAYLNDWDPGGDGMLISTRFAETSQVHFVEMPGGARKQITFFDEPVSGAAMCPDPGRREFLFLKDVGGSEFYQVFHFDMESGSHTMLTDGTSRNGGVLWSHAGDRFIYYSTRRNGRDWDLYVATVARPADAELVLKQGGTWVANDWSPDDSRLVVINYVSINETYLHILDPGSGKLTPIYTGDEKVAFGGGVWAKDGTGIYLTSDEGSEFRRLTFYDLNEKTFTDLTAGIPWDVESLEISPDGSTLAFTVNEGGVYKLYLMDTSSREYEEVAGIPLGEVYGLEFSPDSGRLGLVINTPRTPGDIHVLDMSDRSLERWTYSEVGGLDNDSFVIPELVHYETFDDVGGRPRMIPAFYYRPHTGSEPFPVIVYLHGGPESQYTPYFSSRTQYFLNELGVAVIAPNVRGSSGYGKGYLLLDNGYRREDSVRDVGALLDWIEEQPELDGSRVAVYGGSYGGYMVLASMIHYNDRLACGVDVVGISNFVTFLENTKEYRRDLRRVEYGDERDPDMRAFLEEISPTAKADRITKPMFIIQGLNDPRVPVGESEQIVEAIRKNDGDVWYLLAKDEGHGFRKKSNRDYYQNAMMLFFEQYLLK